MRKPLFSYWAGFLALVALVISPGLINAQGIVKNDSSQWPGAYQRSSTTMVVEHIDGVGAVTREVNVNNYILPNTATVYSPTGAEQSLVYDNGPHYNVAGSPNLSVLESSTLGMDTYGANISYPDYGAADDFVLDEETEITSIDLYSYQTGVSAPSINAAYMQIWDGDPSAGGSVVWGDLSTNVLGSVSSSGAYRVLETTQSDRTRMIQKVTVDITGLTLAAGTYYLEYSLGGTSSSGPWQAPVAILGQATTGNAIQRIPGGWQAMLDSGTNTPQGLPFQIYGNTSGGSSYCIPAGTNSSYYIDSFSTTGGIDNISNLGSGFSDDGYGDFYATHAVKQAKGEDVEFVAEFPANQTYGFRVWVDWNQDGIFDTTEEVAWNSSGYDNPHSGSFTVPSDALEGETRMRIAGHWLNSTGDVDPCSTTHTYGEFEDYKFIIEDGGTGNDYCIPAGTNSSYYIDSFSTTGGIDNISNLGSGFSDDGYGDFYATHAVKQAKGEDVEFLAEFPTGQTYGFRIWVDWNQDGVFDTTEEVVWNSSSYANPHSGSFTVPADALEGETRMRIVGHWLNSTGDIDPCSTTHTYGEFEDYKFIVEEGGDPTGYCDDISTIYTGGNNGSPGGAVYFDVTVDSKDIVLTALDLNTDNSGSAFTVDVYTIEGTYAGNETNQSAWTLQTQGSGTSAGEGNASHAELDDSITLSANTTYGIALVLSSNQSHHYTNGTGSNEHFENDDLALDLGSAMNTPWSGTAFSPRVFNGGLYYEVDGGCGGVDPVEDCEIDFAAVLDDGTGNLQTILFAEDFEIEDGGMSVEKVTFRVFNNIGEASLINIYEDDGGTPGAIVQSFSNVAPDSQAVFGNAFGFMAYDVEFTLPSAVELDEGIYWVGIQTTIGTDGGINYWVITNEGVHSPGKYTQDGGATWVTNSSGYDFSFKLEGDCDGGSTTPTDCPVSYEGELEDGLGDLAEGIILAADFPVEANEQIDVEVVRVQILNDLTSIEISFYEDNGGQPGAQVFAPTSITPASQTLLAYSSIGTEIFEYELDMSSYNISLSGGSSGAKYWMAITTNGYSNYWGYATQIHNGTNFFGSLDGYATWEDLSAYGFIEDGAFSINCEASDPGDPQCNFNITSSVEPISRVVLADIDNSSSPVVGGSPALEDFTNIEGLVNRESTYNVSLEGNTDGPFTNFFTVWVDWNQDGEWDSSEMYEIGSINNSTGTDGKKASGTITVPADAVLGATTMRVIKNFNTSPTNPCGVYSFGQGEDYTIIVDEYIGIDDQSAVSFSYYPNPTSGIVNIEANRDIISVSVMNILGQQVLATKRLENGQVNLSSLATGAYMFRVTFEDGSMETFKVIKE